MPVVLAIAHVDESVVREIGAVTGLRNCCAGGASGLYGPSVHVIRLVAVGAPVAFELSGIGVDDGDALVQVSVGEIRLVRRRIDEDLRDASEACVSLLPPT